MPSSPAEAQRRRRRGRARHDGRDERGAPAPRRRVGPPHDAELPRRARATPPARPAHVRPLLAQAAAARGAPPPVRGVGAAWPRTGRSWCRSRRRTSGSAAARLRELGIGSVAVCFLHSYLYPAHEQRAGAILAEELPEATISLSSEILTRAAGVRAHGDDGGQRVRAAADVVVPRPDPDGARRDRAGRRTAPDHAVLRRCDDHRRRRGARPVFALVSGPAAGVVGAPPLAQSTRDRERDRVRYGRHDAKASLIEQAISRGASTRGRLDLRGQPADPRRRRLLGSRPSTSRRSARAAGASPGSTLPAACRSAAQRGRRSRPACYGRGASSRP